MAGIEQRTIKNVMPCRGIGLHSGNDVRMVLKPAAPGHGIQFVRTDLAQGPVVIPARYDLVHDTRMCTVIGDPAVGSLATIEHLMAALAGLQIDNILVEVDSPELPVMDGSSAPFIFMLECAGIESQGVARRVLRVLERVEVRQGDRWCALEPHDGFVVDSTIDFAHPSIGRQSYSFEMFNGAFKQEICRARTFGFYEENEKLRALGLGKGASLNNAVVLDQNGVMNPDGLRYRDEFARHKVLDIIGDLALAGAPIRGRFVGEKSGHGLHNQLLRQLFATAGAWRLEGDQGPRPSAVAA